MAIKKISDSERKVMEVLWQESPLTLSEIVERVQQKAAWSGKTIQTFVNRLKQKGAVSVNKDSVFTYAPTISKEETSITEVQRIVEKLYGDSMNQFITSFLGNAKLSEEDIEEIAAFLNSLKQRR
jgi:BlaI family penicillinase repressor